MSDGPRPTRLYLIRHCDVRNPGGLMYGHLPDFPLSELGVRQAHGLGEALAASGARTIFTSPLERARQTAEIIAAHLDGATVTETDDLVEAEFGRYLQGVAYREILWRRPLWYLHMLRPGMLANDESVPAMAARVQRPLQRLLDERPGEGGICVSHGDPIQAFWVSAEGRRAYALHRLQCAKGGRLELDYRDGALVGKRYIPPAEAGIPASPEPGIEATA
ncbi:MAG: histidine phosphatase family protein [Candidatus Dormibacteria bacterium]